MSYRVNQPSQGALDRMENHAASFFDPTGLFMATVLLVRYPDGDSLATSFETTYDVIMHTPRYRANKVRVLRTRAGTDGGDEVVFKPIAKTFKAAARFDISKADMMDTDGDLVAVQFLNGDRRLPVIVGALGHPKAVQGGALHVGSVAKGERRFMSHKGTSVEIDKDGNVTVTLAEGKVYRLGSASSEEPMTLGNVLIEALNALVGSGADDILQNPSGLFLSSAPGFPCTVNPAVASKIAAWVNKYLTDAATNIVSAKTKTER